MSVGPAQSVTIWLYEKIEGDLQITKKTGRMMQIIKTGCTLAISPVFALAALVESCVRGILLVTVKCLHVLTPAESSYSKKMRTDYVKPILDSIELNIDRFNDFFKDFFLILAPLHFNGFEA